MDPTALRKRPSQQRSQATIAAVLEAAAQILEAGGLAAFNTNAIALRAGVSIGTLYQYFPGKHAVMAALVRREAARFDGALADALAAVDAAPLNQAVSALVAVAVEHQRSRPNLAQILDLEERRLGLGAEADAATQGIARRLEAFLARRRIAAPAIAARDLLHMARGMIDGASKDVSDDLVARISRAALGYLYTS